MPESDATVNRLPVFIYRLQISKDHDCSPQEFAVAVRVDQICSRSRWPRGLRPLDCWDCGFESCRGHGCLSVVSVGCCQVEVSATG